MNSLLFDFSRRRLILVVRMNTTFTDGTVVEGADVRCAKLLSLGEQETYNRGFEYNIRPDYDSWFVSTT